jgi:hypothetical protein
MWQMPISENARSAAAIHRKLRALAAVFLDPAATEHEKANASRLTGRQEKQLSQEVAPEIRGLADGGPDHPLNVAAVCPNCHSRVTHGRDAAEYNSVILANIRAAETRLQSEAR